jgi:hypothetical protein
MIANQTEQEQKTNGLVLSTVQTKHGEKYSPNLYQFLRHNKLIRLYGHVWKDKENTLWIGLKDDGFFIGARLIAALCHGGKTPTASHAGIGPLTEVKNFWNEYLQIGRCAIDRNHQMPFIGSENRFRTSDDPDIRTCKWCGITQQRKIHARTVIEEKWIAV